MGWPFLPGAHGIVINNAFTVWSNHSWSKPIMYLRSRFLVSMLCGLMIVPLVHNAGAADDPRLEAGNPCRWLKSRPTRPVAANSDGGRRLEMSVDQLKNKTTSQLAELGKKARDSR